MFLLYILGSFSASLVGGWAGRVGRRTVFWMPIAVVAAGLVLTLPDSLYAIVAGVALVTAGFFGAHSVASSWVGRRAGTDRGLGAAFYLLFYYLGSSVLGTAGGIAWARSGWHGVIGFCVAATAVALGIAWRLRGIAPRPGNDPAIPLTG